MLRFITGLFVLLVVFSDLMIVFSERMIEERSNDYVTTTRRSNDNNNSMISDYGAGENRLKDYIDDDDDDDDNQDHDNYSQTTVRNYYLDYDDKFNLHRRIISNREFAEEMKFLIYKNDKLIYMSNGLDRDSIEEIGCNPDDKFTFLLHGWREDSETEWLAPMITNFNKYRGGCVIVIDYGYHADVSYFKLVQRFDSITEVIFEKIDSWQDIDLSQTHFFGFSFGGRLALAVGRRFGRKAINSIDICDMAGPGFDFRNSRSDYRDAAENVQCIHTSRDKGTRFYSNCHQNWRLGNCGYNQPGAEDPPYGSHGLCVYYYLLAFDRGFYAHKKPTMCTARNPATKWPAQFKMGYTETRKAEVYGELFVPLSSEFPYAVRFADQNDIDDNVVVRRPMMPVQAIQNNIRKFQNRPVIQRFMKARRALMKRKRNRISVLN